AAGPLPGKSLVVLDPALMLVIDVFPCADGHTQERALLEPVLPTIAPHDLWIEDRNFCTLKFLFGVAARQACFVVRQHQNLPWVAVTELEYAGECEGAELWDQKVQLDYPQAALFGFCVALVAYNVLAVVRAALRVVHGPTVVEEQVSTYYLAAEIKGVYQGMMIALPPAAWERWRRMTVAQLAVLLKD